MTVIALIIAIVSLVFAGVAFLGLVGCGKRLLEIEDKLTFVEAIEHLEPENFVFFQWQVFCKECDGLHSAYIYFNKDDLFQGMEKKEWVRRQREIFVCSRCQAKIQIN